MPAADAGQHGGDMPVADVERLAELAVAPGDARQPPLEGGDRQLRAAALDLRGEIEADGFRIGRRLRQALAAQPGRELPPVGGVGALGVVGLGRAGVGLGGLGQAASRPLRRGGVGAARPGRTGARRRRRRRGGPSSFVGEARRDEVRSALRSGSAGGRTWRLAEAARRPQGRGSPPPGAGGAFSDASAVAERLRSALRSRPARLRAEFPGFSHGVPCPLPNYVR